VCKFRAGRTPENRRGGLFYGPGKSSDAKSGGPGEKFRLELTSHKRPKFVRTGAKKCKIFPGAPCTQNQATVEYVGTVIECQSVQIHNEKDDIGITVYSESAPLKKPVYGSGWFSNVNCLHFLPPFRLAVLRSFIAVAGFRQFESPASFQKRDQSSSDRITLPEPSKVGLS